jgi:phospholipid transport system transporter-binding protein
MALALKVEGPGIWHLQGELSFQSVSHHYASLLAQRPQANEWQIDLSAIHRIDSAGLAYLLDCIRYAESQALRLKLKGLPKEAKNLIQMHGLASILSAYLEGG